MSIRIPVREEKGRLQALPGARVQAATAGTDALAAVGRGIQDAGRPVVEAIAAEEQRQRTNALAAKKSELMDLDRKHRENMRTVKGKNAIQRKGDLEEAYDRDSKLIVADTGNRAVRDQVQRFSERHAQSFRNSLGGHVAREAENEARLAYASIQEGAANDAAIAWAENDMGAYQDAVANATGATLIRTEQQGLGEGESETALNEVTTRLHASVLSHLLSEEQEFKAEEYFKNNKGEMSVAVADKFGKVIEASSRKERARITEQGIVDFAKKGGQDENDIAKMILEIEDTKERDLVLEFHNQRKRVTENARQQTDKPRIGTLRLGYLAEGKNPTLQPEYEALSDIGKSNMLAWFNSEKRRRRADRKSARQASVWPLLESRFNALRTDGEPGNDQASIDIYNSEMFQGAGELEFNKLVERQRRTVESIENGESQSLASFTRDIRRAASARGLKGDDFDTYSIRAYEEWDTLLNIRKDQQLGGKGPSRTEVSTLLADLDREFVTNHGWFSDTVEKAFELPQEHDFEPVVGFDSEAEDEAKPVDEPEGHKFQAIQTINENGVAIGKWHPIENGVPEGWAAIPGMTK